MIPNLLSAARIFLAAAFFQEDVSLRLAAILLALLTDFLDGYLARRFNQTTKYGVILDPIADRIFVGVAVFSLFFEGRLTSFEIGALFSRDAGIALFGLYLFCTQKSYPFHALLTGKIATTIQLAVLLFLTLNLTVPQAVYIALVLLGPVSFFELYMSRRVNFI